MGKKITNWEHIFEQHRQSAKSITQFCNEIGIHPNIFYKHRKITGRCGIIEVKLVASVCSAPIIL
ncbi:MAG: hypothetical protein JEZ04_22620 [Spirochaetales bacterium]|nr:hypothetical protein [Spirochaetales bacterium]